MAQLDREGQEYFYWPAFNVSAGLTTWVANLYPNVVPEVWVTATMVVDPTELLVHFPTGAPAGVDGVAEGAVVTKAVRILLRGPLYLTDTQGVLVSEACSPEFRAIGSPETIIRTPPGAVTLI